MTTPPVSGYVTWFDASDVSSVITSGGGVVTGWNDKSGNGYNTLSAGGGQNITYDAASSSIVFNGSSKYLVSQKSLTGLPQNWNFFIVFKSTSGQTSGYQMVFRHQDSTYHFQINGQDGIYYGMGWNPTGEYHVDGVLKTPDAGGIARYDIRTTHVVSVITSNPNVPSQPGLFRFSDEDLGRFFTGTINEVLIYPAITWQQRTQVEAYLATKWGLASAFPASYSSLLAAAAAAAAPAYTLTRDANDANKVVGYTGTLPLNLVIPDGVTSIGAEAFARGTFTSVTFPASLTTIGEGAFNMCANLASVTFLGTECTVAEGAFSSIETAVFNAPADWVGPPSIGGLFITGFGYSDPATKKVLAGYGGTPPNNSLVIPDGVTSIGDGAFVTRTFTSVTFPASLQTIGVNAFFLCTSLSSVTFPASLTTIGDHAFALCTRLTSVEIPVSVTSIGLNAFSSCSGLASLTFSSPRSQSLFMGNNAFSGTALTSVTIPDSVTSIGNGMFGGCSVLESVTFPASLQTIGDGAFQGCTSRPSITFLGTDFSGTVGDYAFDFGIDGFVNGTGVFNAPWNWVGPENLGGLTLNRGQEPPTAYTLTRDANDANKVVGYTGTLPLDLVIPAGVTSIGDEAFTDRPFTSVKFPASLTTIGDEAFARCTNLSSVQFPDSLQTIGDYAFALCTIFTNIEIPASLTTIGAGSFVRCGILTTVTFLGTPVAFGLDIFESCGSLAAINVPWNWTGPPTFNNGTDDIAVTAASAFTDLDIQSMTYNSAVITFTPLAGSGFTYSYIVRDPGSDFTTYGNPTGSPFTVSLNSAGNTDFDLEMWSTDAAGLDGSHVYISFKTPVKPGSGSSAGDPYVSTVTNKIYKLPAFNGALRLYQGFAAGKLLTVNATTRIDDDKQAMDADNNRMNSKLRSPVTQNLEMTEAMSFFDKIHVQLGNAHAVFSVYDGFRQLSPLPVGWALHDKGTVADYLKGMPFYAHLAGSVHELSPCEGVTIRLGIVPIRHIRSTVEVAAPNMAEGSGALVHRLSRKQMSLKKLTDMKPIAASKDAPVKRVIREAFVCDRATTHADIAFLG